MRIRCITTRPSPFAKAMNGCDKGAIAYVVSNPDDIFKYNKYIRDLNSRDVLTILFEQSLACNYLKAVNSQSRYLTNYHNDCKKLAAKIKSLPIYSENSLGLESISIYVADAMVNYALNEINTPPPKMVDDILNLMRKSKYHTLPDGFIKTYLGLNTLTSESIESSNPILLFPTYRRNRDNHQVEITFSCEMYTSISPEQIGNKLNGNRTLKYVAALNYNGKSWMKPIANLMSLKMRVGMLGGMESLPGQLYKYASHGGNPRLNRFTDSKVIETNHADLMTFLKVVFENNNLTCEHTKAEQDEITNLLLYFNDERLARRKYGTGIIGKESFDILTNTQLDYLLTLLFPSTIPEGKSFIIPEPTSPQKPYAMAVDSGDDSSSSDDDSSSDDAASDSGDNSDEENDNNDNENGGEDFDKMGDDLFGNGDDFADDGDNDSDSDSDGDDSSDGGDSDSSESDNDSDSGDDSDDGSDDNNKSDADDTNPLVILIDDETFDEYLDRSILQARIGKLLANPPSTISSSDIDFLRYWYLVWFPCVSVSTTREMIGDILGVKVGDQS